MTEVEETTNVDIVFHAHLKGGQPMIDFCAQGDGWTTEWLDRVASMIAAGKQAAAKEECLLHAKALLIPSEAVAVLGDGDGIPGRVVDVSGVEIYESDGRRLLRFYRWYASFVVSVPRTMLTFWSIPESVDGRRRFSLDRYENWLESKDIWGLQDAVRFYLWGVLYDLDGMGEQSCVPDASSVNAVWS